jgi:quercetin dioxygenase-like cupin family protein
MNDLEQSPSENPMVEVLKEKIQYQAGGVVSRTLIQGETGTVTLFAFDSQETLSEHTAPFQALLIALDGEAEVMIAGKTFLVHDGQTILLPANQPHALKAMTAFKMLLVMIRAKL